jgi:hypothetical protein
MFEHSTVAAQAAVWQTAISVGFGANFRQAPTRPVAPHGFQSVSTALQKVGTTWS